MLHSLISRLPSAPRLDFTLVAFAVAGLVVVTLMPPRVEPAGGQLNGEGAGRAKSYAIAISSGDAMTLAAGSAGAAAAEPGSRVLACRHVVSLGPLDIGQRCKPSAPIKLGSAASE